MLIRAGPGWPFGDPSEKIEPGLDRPGRGIVQAGLAGLALFSFPIGVLEGRPVFSNHTSIYTYTYTPTMYSYMQNSYF